MPRWAAVTLVFAAGAVFLRGSALAAWAGAFALVLAWGVVSLRSGIFGRAHVRGPDTRPWVALTYDDGPDAAATPALLDVLARRGARATFFVVGDRVRAHPAVVARCLDEGHALGNHSDRHRAWTNFLPKGPLARELARCQDAVAAAAGTAPRFYRPPVGLANPVTEPAARAAGLELAGWTVRSLDTWPRAPEAVARRVLRRVRPGSIVLLHDGGRDPARVTAITERILEGLGARGLEAVTLDRLLAR